ncbi:hypothetical protein AYO44_18775, partial [Planctomycetaceae bacterium SCGC AG-212-F19]
MPEKGKPGAVLVFLAVDCPLARLYAPRLEELHARYQDQVHFVGLVPDRETTPAAIAAFVHQHHLSFPVVIDEKRLAERLRATRTPEVIVLDADGVQYQGRIDDQYGIGSQRARPKVHYLADALDALLAGRAVATPRTTAVGCLLDRPRSAPAEPAKDYSKHIAPILFRRCLDCHRPGRSAPFALTSYRETVRRAGMIREVIARGQMPPWGADPKHGRFANDASLTAEEKQLIYTWIDAGCPEGNPADLPPLPPLPPEGWRIAPDVVYTMRDPVTIPAEGVLEYQRFLIDPGLVTDRLIQAIQIRPGNPAVMHHATVSILQRANAPLATDMPIPSGDEHLAMYVPGQEVYLLPPGTAKSLPANSLFVLEVHYTPLGRVQQDQTQIGIVWADPATVRRRITTWVMVDTNLILKPALADQKWTSDFPFDTPVLLHALFPHMHLRGRTVRFDAVFPDGSEEVLLLVPRYDFAWQHRYILAEPRRLPAGTTIRISAVFDNSADNPRNPDPNAYVRYGEQTSD